MLSVKIVQRIEEDATEYLVFEEIPHFQPQVESVSTDDFLWTVYGLEADKSYKCR